MHFHAEHSLFFEQRHSVWRSGLSLGLTIAVLIVNAGVDDAVLSFTGAAFGIGLLIHAYIRGHNRIEPAVTWALALVALVIIGGVALNGDLQLFINVASRVSCGVVWVLWLGTRLDWSSLRQLLRYARLPESVVSTLDHALMHGILTKREWTSRRNAARLRTGSTRLSLPTLGHLLGEGALHAFLRLERVEENALIRASSMTSTDVSGGVELKNVTVRRGEQTVLERLNFSLAPKEWLLLCGPSGAGKSSLLRLLAGLDCPVEGSMNRLGSIVETGANLRARLDGRVALLFQNPEHHFIASTVAEDIAWGLIKRGVPSDEARSRTVEIAKTLAIGSLLDRPCHNLSFGEQRRVALAGLLVLEPSLLLLDEPTSGLDPVAAHTLLNVVQTWVEKTGAACIWATHDLHLHPSNAHRVVLLKDGQMIFDGSKAEGLSRPWMLRAGLAVALEGESSC